MPYDVNGEYGKLFDIIKQRYIIYYWVFSPSYFFFSCSSLISSMVPNENFYESSIAEVHVLYGYVFSYVEYLIW